MLRWICRNKTLTVVTAFGTLLAAAFPVIFWWFESQRTADQDARERSFKFHDITNQAEHLYCQTKDTGVPANLKVLIDQAVQLESGIQERLSPLNYITLASLGSVVLTYDKAHTYAVRGLQIANGDDGAIDRYAANLVLGHIDFLRFLDTSDARYLVEARNHFGEAKDLVDDKESPRNLYFVGQLYLIWGTNELFAKQLPEGEIAISSARRAWEQLPQKEDRLKHIDREVEQTNRGMPPRLPCPSMVAVSPQYFEPLLDATVDADVPQADSSDQRSSGSNDTSPSLGGFDKKFDDLALDMRTEIRTFADRLSGEIRALRPIQDAADGASSSGSTGTADGSNGEKPTLPSDDMPQKDSGTGWKQKPRCDPATNPNCCSFVVLNKTDHDVRLTVNGYFDPNHFVVGAGRYKTFYLLRNALTLLHR